MRPATPLLRLWLVLLVAFGSVLAALLYSANQPWLNAPLQVQGSALISGDKVVQAINGMPLAASDLAEDPGYLDNYADLEAFYARQQAFSALLQDSAHTQKSVTLRVLDADQNQQELRLSVAAQRPLGSLPTAFWVQCLVAFGSMLIGGWVWAMRPHEWSTRLFALSGLSVVLFAGAAACYSTRELALPVRDWRWLLTLNQLGSVAYGFAMIAFFFFFPKRLCAPCYLWVFAGLYLLYAVLLVLRILPAGIAGPITGLQMLGILLMMLVQAWVCRRLPVERASLTWLGLTVAVGAGAFIGLSALPQIWGSEGFISQAYGFLFFLLIYVGLALGLQRFRLFDIGSWAFKVLFFMLGSALLLLLDLALIALLGLSFSVAAGASLLLVGVLYLPLRDWLQRRLAHNPDLPQHELFARAMNVAFAPTPLERQKRWQDLLHSVFSPLLIENAASAAIKEVAIEGDGLALFIPASADTQALRLEGNAAGRGLFGSKHQELAQRLLELLHRAHDSRLAYEQGVQNERVRVAQDLHDDIGSRLLTSIHSADAQLRPLLQETLADVRTIAKGLTGAGSSLHLLLAELRHETMRRCELAQVQLKWPVAQSAQLLRELPAEQVGQTLDYRWSKALLSSVREVVSNAIKHAQAQSLTVGYRYDAPTRSLHLQLQDDGVGMQAPTPTPEAAVAATGVGLTSIQNRLNQIGGQVEWLSSPEGGTRVYLILPLD